MPVRICMEARCANEAVYRGRCRPCSRGRERETHPNKSFYNSTKWKRTRDRQLFDHPLCECGAIATDVDHIVPIEWGGDKWAPANLSSKCASCHGKKTRREQATR